MSIGATPIQDSLYGELRLDKDLVGLLSLPVVQRLRHVRLSNIDSLDMPGIANISRYEHVLGVAHLAQKVGIVPGLSDFDRVLLLASALLHDAAITSYGHLVEEAFQYLGTGFTHESRLMEILSGEPGEILGIDRQVLAGREMGLRGWATKITRSIPEGERLVEAIFQHILGNGRMGRLVAGDIDLDNIDSVFRMAFHMGLSIDRATPGRLAGAIIHLSKDSEPVFCRAAEADISSWCATRYAVYDHLMLSPRDFAGKVMMLYATIHAFKSGEIETRDWNLTDYDFLHRLMNSRSEDVRDNVQRWIVGEMWDLAPLMWMKGIRPNYVTVLKFSEDLSDSLGRTCFAYAIKDKRERRLRVHFDNATIQDFGENSDNWLLGLGSPVRKKFSSADNKAIFEHASCFFNSEVVGAAALPGMERKQGRLL